MEQEKKIRIMHVDRAGAAIEVYLDQLIRHMDKSKYEYMIDALSGDGSIEVLS